MKENVPSFCRLQGRGVNGKGGLLEKAVPIGVRVADVSCQYVCQSTINSLDEFIDLSVVRGCGDEATGKTVEFAYKQPGHKGRASVTNNGSRRPVT